MSEAQLIEARYMITMDDDRPVLENHGLILQDHQIAAILSPAEVADSSLPKLTLREHILLPGLINLHGHSAMTLFRGYADDLALMDWLNNHIWPLEKKWLSGEFIYDGTRLAMAEMILSGTTTVNDMYFYHDAVARAGIDTGLRTVVGCSILEFPTNYAENADDYLEKAKAAIERFQNEPLIGFTLAPHAPYTVSDATFKKIAALAEEKDLLVHCHIHETQTEIDESMKTYGMRPISRLNHLGILNERLIAAHMVHLNDEEIKLAHDARMSVAHNPSSNLKLASGFAPVRDLLAAHVNVGLGTDGAASNNSLNMFREIRLAALIAKGQTQDPTALPAYEALKMATINGARALHLDDKIGSIATGKSADLIAVNFDSIAATPLYDPISHLVYTLGREDVTDVWINGDRLLKNRQFAHLNSAEIKQKAQNWAMMMKKKTKTQDDERN